MKVVQVSTSDRGGGAERIAWTLFNGFERRGVDAWLVVGQKHSDHEKVVPVYASPFVDYRPYGRLRARTKSAVARTVESRLGLESFHHPYSRRLLEMTGPPAPDVVICHNLHGGYFDLRSLAFISRSVPVVLSLADSWMLTGHCAVPAECTRWEHGCGSCPDLATPPAIRRDATGWNWRRKRKLYRDCEPYVATPSRWLLEQVGRSSLADAVVEGKVIPYGIDLETFRPGDKEQARANVGLPSDARVLLFVAQGGSRSPRKDYPTVLAAAELCAREVPFVLVLVGEGGNDEVRGNLVVKRLGAIASDAGLADHYRAADVLLHATPYETFGLAIAEAMACGLPVVATSVGAVPELIDDGSHGLLVGANDPQAVAEAALRIISDEILQTRLSTAATQRAQAFGRDAMVDRYLDLCREAIDGHGRHHESPTPTGGRSL